MALSGRVRPGPGAQRWGAPVPDAAQSVSWIRGPKADQLQASDVTGKLLFMSVVLKAVFVMLVTFAGRIDDSIDSRRMENVQYCSQRLLL